MLGKNEQQLETGFSTVGGKRRVLSKAWSGRENDEKKYFTTF